MNDIDGENDCMLSGNEWYHSISLWNIKFVNEKFNTNNWLLKTHDCDIIFGNSVL